jgi:glycosyltransferase involved in cell wall biosynthesis
MRDSEEPEQAGTLPNTVLISVVVPTYNRGNLIRECLDSLVSQQFPKEHYEIIIIDSSTTDIVKKIIEDSYQMTAPKITYFYQKKEGPSAARNLGIAHATGDIIYFFDDDCLADKDCLKIIYSAYDREEIGGVEGRVAGYYSSTVVQKYGDYLFLRTNVRPGDLLPDMDGPITCNASYKKDVLTAVKGFDTQFITMEDLDLALRIREKGYFFKHMPSAVVYHKHRTSLGEVVKRGYFFAFTGVKFLCDKYPESYSLKKILLINVGRIFFKIVSYPYIIITVGTSEDKKFYLSKPFLDILLSLSRITGLIAAVMYRKKYASNDPNS